MLIVKIAFVVSFPALGGGGLEILNGSGNYFLVSVPLSKRRVSSDDRCGKSGRDKLAEVVPESDRSLGPQFGCWPTAGGKKKDDFYGIFF